MGLDPLLFRQFPSVLRRVAPVTSLYLKWGRFVTMTDIGATLRHFQPRLVGIPVESAICYKQIGWYIWNKNKRFQTRLHLRMGLADASFDYNTILPESISDDANKLWHHLWSQNIHFSTSVVSFLFPSQANLKDQLFHLCSLSWDSWFLPLSFFQYHIKLLNDEIN